jgi:predicted SprT family Zn-dependent metalloprotease
MELKKAQDLAKSLMVKHGISDWAFKFDTAKRRFGCCIYVTKTISLSKHLVLLNSEYKVMDTILHEIAHALTPGHGHNDVWRRKAIEIGCNGERCYSSDDTIVPNAKYVATCSGCNKSYNRFKKQTLNLSCGPCSGGKYNSKFKLVFIQNKETSGNLSGLTV